MDEPYTLSDAVESAQIWLRAHHSRTKITAYRDVDDLELLIVDAARHAAVIHDAAPVLGLQPGVVAWAQQHADDIIAFARERLVVRRAIDERRDARAAMRAADLAAAEEIDGARARRATARNLTALVGMSLVVTIDGRAHAGRITHATRGPVLHLTCDDDREILIAAR